MPFFKSTTPTEKKVLLGEHAKRLAAEGKVFELEKDGSFQITWAEEIGQRVINYTLDTLGNVTCRQITDRFGTHDGKSIEDAEIALKIVLNKKLLDETEELGEKIKIDERMGVAAAHDLDAQINSDSKHADGDTSSDFSDSSDDQITPLTNAIARQIVARSAIKQGL